MRPCSLTGGACTSWMDRGWSESALRALWVGEGPEGDPCRGEPDIWAVTSAEDIEETARVVVGPDAPPDGYMQEGMEAGHWAYLAGLLRQQGVAVDATELTRLPHDVVLSERLPRARRSCAGRRRFFLTPPNGVPRPASPVPPILFICSARLARHRGRRYPRARDSEKKGE